MKLVMFLLLIMSFSVHSECLDRRHINVLNFDWASSNILTAIEVLIIEKGFGCRVNSVSVTSDSEFIVILEQGKTDIVPEMWVSNYSDDLIRLEKAKLFQTLRNIYPGAEEGWYIPNYLLQKSPNLKKVIDLGGYSHIFKEGRATDKGIFISCPAKWKCTTINYNLLAALNLHSEFETIIPSSEEALTALITEYYSQKKPFVFYYWSPTALIGHLSLTQLKMPIFNYRGHVCNAKLNCTSPYPGGYPITDVSSGVSIKLAEDFPKIREFIGEVYIETYDMSQLMALAERGEYTPDEVAHHFLKTKNAIWYQWVPRGVQIKLEQYLKQN